MASEDHALPAAQPAGPDSQVAELPGRSSAEVTNQVSTDDSIASRQSLLPATPLLRGSLANVQRTADKGYRITR